MIDFEKEKKEIWKKNKVLTIPRADGSSSGSPKLNSGPVASYEPTAAEKTAKKLITEAKEKKASEPKTIPKADSRKSTNNNRKKTTTGRRKKVSTEAKQLQQKEAATHAIPQAMMGLTEGVINTSVPGVIYSAITGEKMAEPTQAMKEYGMEDSFAYKAGKMGGQMIGYAAPYKAAEKAITKGAAKVLGTKAASKGISKVAASKAGQKIGKETVEKAAEGIARNIVGDATIGTALNFGLARGEGLEGEELAKDMAINAALDFGVGGAVEIAPATLKAFKNAKNTHIEPRIVNGKVKNVRVKNEPADIPVNDAVRTAKPQDIPRADERIIPQTMPEATPAAEPIRAMSAESVQRITKAIEKRSGIKVSYQDLPEGIDGVYENGNIIISSAAKNPAYTVLKHELTHHIESSGNYQALSDFIESSMRNSGYDVDSALARITEDYARIGRSLSPEQAKKEFVAKFSEEFLFNSEKSIERLARENPGMFRQIYDWIVDTVKKIGASEETKFLIDAQRKYEKALRTVGETNGGESQLLYAGSRSLMADEGLKQQAIQMQAAGASAEEIWKKTGWKFGKDQKWRYEIDDSKAIFDRKGLAHMLDNEEFMRYREMGRTGDFFNPEYASLDSTYGQEVRRKKTQLSQFIKHKELFDAYPRLRGTKVEFVDDLTSYDGTRVRGLFDGNSIKIDSGLSSEQAKETLLHEIQHAIQSIEDFERGGDYSEGLKALRKRVVDLIEADENTAEYKKLYNLRFEDAIKGTNEAEKYIDNFLMQKYNTTNLDVVAEKGYLQLAGEREAQSTATRRNLLKEQRREMYPDYDEKAITRKDYYTGWGIPQAVHEDGLQMPAGKNSLQDLQRRTESDQANPQMGIQHNDRLGVETKRRNSDIRAGESPAFSIEEGRKERQLKIILNSNPAPNDYSTWVRSSDDIKTFEETLKDSDWEGWETTGFNPDWTGENAMEALRTGKVTVYSSYPIEQGVFVSPSKMEAASYSGTGKVYSETVRLEDIAWLDPTQGQYAKISNSLSTPGELNKTKYTDDLHSTSQHLYGETGNKYMEIPKAGEEPAFYNAQNDASQAPNTAEPAAPVRGAKKAAAYEKRQQRYFVEKTKEALGVSKYADNKKIQEMVSAAGEKMKAGGMSQAERDAMFDTMFTDGIVKDYELISRYGDLKSTLRNTALKVTDDIRKNIADFNDFRKGIFGSMRLSNEGGAQVDIFYDELRSMYPELFPELNTPTEMVEKMADVAKNLGVTEKRLVDMEGVNADTLYLEARAKFNEALDELEKQENIVKKHVKKKAVLSPEEGKTYIDNIKMMRREIEQVNSKILLDEQDSEFVDLLLKGKLQPETIPKLTINSDNVLTMYEAKAKLQNAEAALKKLGDDTKAGYHHQADVLLEGSEMWKDKIGFSMARETPERVMQDVAGTKTGKALSDNYIRPIHENEAASTRMKIELRRVVKGLNISTKPQYRLGERFIDAPGLAEQLHEMGKSGADAKLSESMLVQLYGEGFVDEQFITALGADVEKIKNAVDTMRTIYNQLIDTANQELLRHGYEPIEYRQNYFPHFSETRPDGALAKLMNKLGMNVIKEELPTDIAGLTHTFRPGKKWFGNALSRKGIATEYDAVKGFDIYLEGVADVIHHTEDIQKLRALENELRFRFSDEGVKERIRNVRDNYTLSDVQREALLDEIYKAGNTKLGSFATWLRNYTDTLAGKKAGVDRVFEHNLGRTLYNTSKAIEGRVAANMVALNPGSWLTNFIPLVQAGELKNSSIIKGMAQTVSNHIRHDNFSDMSAFLTNRKGSDVLWKSGVEKTQDLLTKPMKWIDDFVSESLTRAKYMDAIEKGMSPDEAIKAADELAASIIADRSKGALPNVFNAKNPVSKIFTMYQVEVNNQWSHLLKDIPRNADSSAQIAAAFTKFAIGAYIFNDVYEHFVGRRPALDPLSWINELAGDTTGKEIPNFADALWSAVTEEDYELSFDTEKKSGGGAVTALGENVVQDIPFVGGLLEGGRVPISSALPDAAKLATTAGNLISGDVDTKKGLKDLGKEMAKPAAYILPPVGGGQIKKMVEAGTTYAKQGNYALDGNGEEKLRYSVEQKPGQLIKGMLFGQYAMGTGDEYIESGFKMLSAKKTAAYKAALEAGANPTEAEGLLRNINGNKKTEMRQQIMDSGFTVKQKNAMGTILEGEDGRKVDYSSPSAFRYSLLSEAQQKKVDALQSAGVNKGKALDIYEVYGKVEGDTQITKVMGMLAEDNYKTTVFNALGISETAVSEAKLLMKYDLTAKDYEKARQYANTNGNSSVSAKEAKAYLDKRSDLSRKEKYALFKALTTVKDENNPYR